MVDRGGWDDHSCRDRLGAGKRRERLPGQGRSGSHQADKQMSLWDGKVGEAEEVEKPICEVKFVRKVDAHKRDGFVRSHGYIGEVVEQDG
ncbi:hypothetical protein ABW19_dt0209201 [Dactylella cylindrospora]|nr:hypothetical protein ABW19_dt0209201 [Dactylella cylindrospora]